MTTTQAQTKSISEPKEEDYFCLAIDPGETSGWAILSKDGSSIQIGQMPNSSIGMGNFFYHSGELKFVPKLIVYEEYSIRPNKADAHIWSKVPTARVIGVIEGYATQHSVELVSQEPSINETARAMTQNYPKGAHSDNHWRDAVNHGLYALWQKGYIKPHELRTKTTRYQGGQSRKGSI